MIGDIIEIERAKHNLWLGADVDAATVGTDPGRRAPASEGCQSSGRKTDASEENWMQRLFRVLAALPDPR